MWMNESEVDEAAERYALHPVLGPATRTLVNLVRWTNANSDGWPYWQKPAKAADRLMTLIGTSVAYRVAGPERQDATMEAYRAALTPIKSFRTRYMRERNISCDDLFEIIDREGGELWQAELEWSEASKRYEEHRAYTAMLLEEARGLGARVAELKQREAARAVLAELETLPGIPTRRFELATPGAAIWLLPRHSEHGYVGVGRPGVSLGLTGTGERDVVVVKAEGNDEPYSWVRLYPSAVHTLAEARRMWWIIDDTGNLVNWSGDRERSTELRDKNHPGCVVRQGAEFLPETA